MLPAKCAALHGIWTVAGLRSKRDAVPLLFALALITADAALAAPAPIGARQTVNVQVPNGMAAKPFDVPRTLTVPKGFTIRVFARVTGARFMAVVPNGDLLVSSPGSDSITLLRSTVGDAPQRFTFASRLHNPHDIVFHTVDGKPYVYIAESNRIIRAYMDASLLQKQFLK